MRDERCGTVDLFHGEPDAAVILADLHRQDSSYSKTCGLQPLDQVVHDGGFADARWTDEKDARLDCHGPRMTGVLALSLDGPACHVARDVRQHAAQSLGPECDRLRELWVERVRISPIARPAVRITFANRCRSGAVAAARTRKSVE